jgi:N-acetylglucosamine kinase-like BadF-type ATPase
MFVVADMGSTKTDWSFVDKDKKVSVLKTQGFNPYFYSSEDIKLLLESEFADKNIDWNAVTSVYFYGSGCGNEEKCNIVKNALKIFFPNAELQVTHDLLASARALCGHSKGIACILGTGANTCLFDGEKIVANVTSAGFLLGDEGSGAYLGRELIKYYLYQELPQDLEEAFENQYKINRKSLVSEVYSTKHPNAYCATYSKFISKHKENTVIQKLITERFDEFFNRHVSKYEGYQKLPVNFIGSVAFHFSDELKNAAQKHHCTLGIILQTPMEKLIDFHYGL